MKKILILLSVLSTVTIFSQEKDVWKNFNYLLGSWKGEGSGKPGEGVGYFSFQYDLDKNVLTRKSKTEFPATENKPKSIHEDLMIIHTNNSKAPEKAVYFDNENHVINYSISFPNEKEIVFLSEKFGNSPIFRLTYSMIDETTVNIKFEISMDGKSFMNYIEGKSKKVGN